jgi:hypothetical protein
VKGKETIEVLRSLLSDLFRRKTPQFPELPRYFLHERGLVSLATVRNGRKKRAIGFDQHAVKWNFGGRIPNLLGFWESDIAGEGDHEPHIKRALGMPDVASEAVQDAP